MIQIRHSHPRPTQVDQTWDIVRGELICEKCNEKITWGSEFGWTNNGHEYIQSELKRHVCKNLEFTN